MGFRGKLFRNGIAWLNVTGELREHAGLWEGTFLTCNGFYSGPGDRLELHLEDGRRGRFEVLGVRLTRDDQAEVRFALTGPPR
jgi:hypothetical protein